MPRNDSAWALEMIRESMVAHRRRCSMRKCRCTAKDLHEATMLSYSERGRTRFVMLPQAEVAMVAAAVDPYGWPRRNWPTTSEVGRAALIQWLATRRGRR